MLTPSHLGTFLPVTHGWVVMTGFPPGVSLEGEEEEEVVVERGADKTLAGKAAGRDLSEQHRRDSLYVPT